ncbi:MAG: fibro-slime domain-containing protein [Lachnospiraceae bacterium]|nr:fibro-slime domain-containing protein [Lachnospiraceae bacterium]
METSFWKKAAKFLKNRRIHKRWQKVVMCMAAVVVFVTTYMLILPAITMEQEYVCGKEEHVHTDECYEKVLICGKTEGEDEPETQTGQDENGQEETETDEPETAETGHVHTDACYEKQLVCEKEEHEHTLKCYSDPEADVETAEIWEGTIPEQLSGEWAEDITAIAQSQLGYTESTRNYQLEGTDTIKGCTRYGTWYGEPYSDWDAMFVSFCLNYAGISEKSFPRESDASRWMEELSKEPYNCYVESGDYLPETGDLIFFYPEVSENSKDSKGNEDNKDNGTDETVHVGLVVSTTAEAEQTQTRSRNNQGIQVKIIAGDLNDQVGYITFDLTDEQIIGYGQLPEQTFCCGQTGHVHGTACRDDNGNLVCGKEEHIHTDKCKEPETETAVEPETAEIETAETEEPEELQSASAEESTDESDIINQTMETDVSETDKANTEPVELSYRGIDYTVSVSYGPEAGLPDGVKLEAKEILQGTEAYQTYYDQAKDAIETEENTGAEKLVFARFFDIRFMLDGSEVEPLGDVSVTITYDSGVDVDESSTCRAIHFDNDDTELFDVQTEEQDKGGISFTHTQDSFSVTGSLMTKAGNAADIGPESLPVDYYVCIDGEWTCVGSTKTGWYGDYSATDWTDTNRDYITVEQVKSMLGQYGFNDDSKACNVAYQQKSRDLKIYADTNIVEIDGQRVVPLARNADHPGYHLYYIPGNSKSLSGITSLDDENLVKSANIYTIQVYDPGQLVYSESDTLPETQLVLSGQRADNVTVNALPSGTNAAWQCVGSDWKTVTEGVTGTTAEDGNVTFCFTSVTQPLRITPVSNSLGTAEDYYVDFAVFLDGAWTKVGTVETIYRDSDIMKNSEGTAYRRYITSAQAGSVLAPYGFSSRTYNYESGQYNTLAHQLGRFDTTQIFYTDNEAIKLSDGIWAIGLSYWNQDYTMYYLPANPDKLHNTTPSSYNSNSSEMQGNRFWSVAVKDEGCQVYDAGELNDLHWVVGDNGSITVEVRNVDGVLWSVAAENRDLLDVKEKQSGGRTVFEISNITQPVEIVATLANPSFTVQYYGNIPRFADSGNAELKVIDTSGKSLPINGGTMATKKLYLEGTGQNTNQNNGNATELYRVKTVNELTKLYTEEKCEYETSPGLEYFNKLKDNESYTLKEIWVQEKGNDASSTARSDWVIYTYDPDITFTNEAGKADEKTILITEDSVIRLVTDSSSGDYYNGTTFYDYNISSGQNADGRWRTGITGINSESNYGTSLNGQRTWRSGADILAFGNANCGTGMSGYLFDEGPLNKYNGTTSNYTGKNGNYGGATFGLASGLNSDGTIRYNEWITAPKLFNDGDAAGKQTYAGSSLTFNRVGDTYTLSSATLKNSDGQNNTLNGLQYFFNPSPTSGTTHAHIYTNNFWPMDQAAGRTDALWGAYGNPGSFQGFTETNGYNWSSLAANFPISDDGKAHNWFFGMNFSLNFNLTADYEGPLEYYFFGDDDLWVFLDDQLVCDIGGVHSSIGEFVNLRDYLPVGSSGQHTLSFFYTERGASGSTCYMSFTLPSVSTAATERDTGSLCIGKTVKDEEKGADYSQETYRFQVNLYTDENGSELNQTFSYENKAGSDEQDATYGIVKSGGIITLKSGETATIKGIPAGAYYTVTELDHQGYETTVNGNSGYIVSGKVVNGQQSTADFVNIVHYALPATGGIGTLWYTLGGLLLIAAAFLTYIYKRRNEA